jgi:Icc-related predicted phosphoesterase
MIRVAAVGDLHAGPDSAGTIRPRFEGIAERADVLLLAGDLTRRGTPEEARILGEELSENGVPIVAVLGNHDHHSDQQDALRRELERFGVIVLEGEATTMTIGDTTLGVAGTKGFGGGFAGACATPFGEAQMKAFVGHTELVAASLESALRKIEDADARVALLHYAPVEATLSGERLEIYPFLGSYLLAEAIDRVGADVVFHGHAHRGTEKGATPGGIHVRNVAEHVIGHAYNVYVVGDDAASSRDALDAVGRS